MRPIALIVAALLCAVCSSANAKPRHHIVDANKMVGCSDPIMRPCEVFSVLPRLSVAHAAHRKWYRRTPPGLARVMADGAGRVVAPARFIHGRLVCAVNVGMALAARGIRGTGSRLAKSYLHWGHASGPVPGAVAVFNRRGGGHVAIVHHVRPDGTVIYLNPSSRRQAWQVGPYRRKPIAFRIAGGW